MNKEKYFRQGFRQWLKWRKRGKDIDTWMTDGIHPNPQGHRFIAATIFKVLKKEFLNLS